MADIKAIIRSATRTFLRNAPLAANALLIGTRLDKVPPSLLAQTLEGTVERGRRKAFGQFLTPVPLADFLVRLAVDNIEGTILDPCCGAGTIARAAYQWKKSENIAPSIALGQLWAGDKFTFPLQLATTALADPEAIGTPLNIFCHDLRDKHAPEDADEGTNFITTLEPLDQWNKTGGGIAELAGQATYATRAKSNTRLHVSSLTTRKMAEMEHLGLQWTAFFANLDFMEAARSSLVPANSLFSINRGERRGWDKFFYPQSESGIEPQFLKPVVRNSKRLSGLIAKICGSFFRSRRPSSPFLCFQLW